MVWTEKTPEYVDNYLATPRVVGGQFGFWIVVDDTLQVNVANIVAFEQNAKDGLQMVMSNGFTYTVSKEVYALWLKITRMSPQEAEQHYYAQRGLSRANGPLLPS